MKSLFIGGSADGQWRDYPTGQRHVQVIASVDPVVKEAARADRSRFGRMVILHHDDYTAQIIGGPERSTRVFVLDRLGVDGAMEMLIAHYQRPGPDRKP